MARLAAAQPAPRGQAPPEAAPAWWIDALRPLLLRWLAPVTAATAMLIGLSIWHSTHSPGKPRIQSATAPVRPAKTDDVEIDRHLVAAYDAVAQLPGGEPVRFHCREWADNVVLRDPVRGVVIEQRMPRMEIVPVRIETY
jgi:hypothetical protein